LIVLCSGQHVTRHGKAHVMSDHELEGTYWYCLKHHRVETFESADSRELLGPYPTAEEAAHALDTIAEREERYDAEDSEWEGDS
jgi:hypothetical protein